MDDEQDDNAWLAMYTVFGMVALNETGDAGRAAGLAQSLADSAMGGLKARREIRNIKIREAYAEQARKDNDERSKKPRG